MYTRITKVEKRQAVRTGPTGYRAALLMTAACMSTIGTSAAAQDAPAAGPLSPATAAEAQDVTTEAAPPIVSDDIVVTALKRSVSVQDVPVTVALISGEAIARANITSALDLAAITPGVAIQLSPAGFPVASMRGIGSNPSNQSFDQSVALFVDGVFAPRGRDYASSLFDIADIQVIKGGQSAVLGKNTTIGALALSTRRPDDEYGFDFSYSHEFELGWDTFDAAANIPLTSTLAVRLAGRAADLDGWQHNDLLDRDTPNTKTRAGRISLRWQPTDDLDWNVSYQNETYRLKGQVLYAGGDALGVLAGLARAAGDPNFTAAFNDHYRASGRPGFPDDVVSNDSERAISNLSYTFAGDYTLTALTGYLHSTGGFVSNFNAIINGPIYFTSDRVGGTTFSQEVRLTTPRLGMFDLIVGGLYYHDKVGINFGADAVAPTPLTGAENTTFDQTTESWAGFAAVTAHITDNLTLNGGLRYTMEDRSADYTRTVIRPGPLVFALFRPFAPTTLERSSNNLDGSASLQYRFSPDAMAYVSYGRGTKSGGFANHPNDPHALRADGTRAAEFDDEVAKTFELGAKFGRGSGTHLNLAFFHIDLNGLQTSFFSGANFVVSNADARSRGAELDAVLQVSDALRFSLNATYADAVNKNPTPTSRRRLTRAPKWSGIAGVTYSQAIMNDWQLTADATAEFRTKVYHQENPMSPVPPSGGYAKLGLRLAVNDPASGIEVAVIGRNLTDEQVANFGTGAFPALPGAYLASSDAPRTIALQFAIRR